MEVLHEENRVRLRRPAVGGISLVDVHGRSIHPQGMDADDVSPKSGQNLAGRRLGLGFRGHSLNASDHEAVLEQNTRSGKTNKVRIGFVREPNGHVPNLQ